MKHHKFLPRFFAEILPALALVFLANPLHATDGSWISTASGAQTWNTPTNWSSDPSVAGGTDSTVSIQSNITAATNIGLETTPQTAGILNVGDSSGTSEFTISSGGPGGNLVFERSGGAQLNFNQGGQNTLTAPIVLNSNLTIANNVASSQQINGVISGTGGITHTSGRVVFINFTNNTFSGGYTVNGGTTAILSAGNIGSGTLTLSAGTLEAASGGGINLTNSVNLGGSVTRGGSSTNLNLQGAVTLTANSNLTTAGSGGTTIEGNISGAYNLVKDGAQMLTLQGTNSHSGYTEVQEGILQVRNNAIDDAAEVRITGGTLELFVTSQTVDSVAMSSGQITTNAGGTTLTASSFSFTNSGTVSAVLAGGSATLTKTGAGSVSLNRTDGSTYGGGTFVNAGTLLLNNASGSGAGTGNVVVSGGVVGGSGSFSGSLTVNSGGTLAPGASIETLGSGALTFTDQSTFAYEVDSSAAHSVGADLQKVTGNLNLDDVVTLTLSDLAAVPVAFALDTKFTLINYSGSWDGGLFTVGGNVIGNGGTFALGLNTWRLDYNAVSGGENFTGEYAGANFVNMTAVPEPTTWGLIIMAGLGATTLRRRRNQ